MFENSKRGKFLETLSATVKRCGKQKDYDVFEKSMLEAYSTLDEEKCLELFCKKFLQRQYDNIKDYMFEASKKNKNVMGGDIAAITRRFKE